MKYCCQSRINRIELRQERDDVTVHQCVLCGRKHYCLRVDPGKLGAVFTQPAAE